MHNIAKIIRMDLLHVRGKVLWPTGVCTLLFLPFALLYFPHLICIVIPVSGLALYTVVNIDRRWSLERFYATLPFTRTQFIFGRFFSMCLGLLLSALWSSLLGTVCVLLKCYAGKPQWYAAVLRWNATGYPVWHIALYTFTVCCLILGYQFMLLFLFGYEHETAATLIGFPVTMIALAVVQIVVLEKNGITLTGWICERLSRAHVVLGLLYGPFIALIGILWILLMACVSVLFRRKGEWK